MIQINQDEFRLFRKYLSGECGIDVPEEKSYLFSTRLADLVNEEQYQSFKELYMALTGNPETNLKQKVIEVMTTNETAFFRDGHPFNTFRSVILPDLTARRISESLYMPPQISIWSMGCSTGQEVYSIAMLVDEWLEKEENFSRERVFITASDLSREVLEKASSGFYSDLEIKKGLKDLHLVKNFSRKNNGWQVNEKLRKMISFKQFNMAEEFLYDVDSVDIIFCRNVIIYFSKELKQKLLEGFFQSLRPGGVLIMGASENIYMMSDKFEVVYYENSMYYRVKK